jgi:mRNA interferase MazF
MKLEAKRKEIWLADLGMTAKTRPVLILSIPFALQDRALLTVVPHTTAIRGSRFEVPTHLPALRNGVFDAQNLVTIPAVKCLRKLGELNISDFANVEATVQTWLGFKSAS